MLLKSFGLLVSHLAASTIVVSGPTIITPLPICPDVRSLFESLKPLVNIKWTGPLRDYVFHVFLMTDLGARVDWLVTHCVSRQSANGMTLDLSKFAQVYNKNTLYERHLRFVFPDDQDWMPNLQTTTQSISVSPGEFATVVSEVLVDANEFKGFKEWWERVKSEKPDIGQLVESIAQFYLQNNSFVKRMAGSLIAGAVEAIKKELTRVPGKPFNAKQFVDEYRKSRLTRCVKIMLRGLGCLDLISAELDRLVWYLEAIPAIIKFFDVEISENWRQQIVTFIFDFPDFKTFVHHYVKTTALKSVHFMKVGSCHIFKSARQLKDTITASQPPQQVGVLSLLEEVDKILEPFCGQQETTYASVRTHSSTPNT